MTRDGNGTGDGADGTGDGADGTRGGAGDGAGSWRDLFERAAAYDVTVEDVTARLRERRDG